MIVRQPSQIPFDLAPTPSLARDDLIVGEGNALAVEAIDQWPHWSHPVLLVVGPIGSGKTHLATAWAEASGASVLRAGEPASDLISQAPFAVLAEDIDRAGFEPEELFALLNAARLGGGTVLLTSRKPVSAMPFALPDLLSRLRAATVTDLSAPDEALLSGVLMKLATDRQVEFDPRLIDYAVARMERSMEAAAELIRRLDMEALASKERITKTLLQRILAEMDVERSRAS
ncbi:hypothetical protein NS226_01090 [Aureimonas ureilytica]|uniref:Chromosomal replication initiator protein DnaA domain-containing protein n=1 Tax=Aureimonas ureilytica TaxID=401562 RepID=A0A175RFN1_9HYPH|nr:hypothetical protein NS226_01090 [Aureimonas ureilytica]